jgi:hypothetical protein
MLDEMVDFMWDKSIMMLLLSVPLLAWGLKNRLYPLAISAMLILIFEGAFPKYMKIAPRSSTIDVPLESPS